MNIYVIKAWNKHGGCIGNYYVVAKGVNSAKQYFRENEPDYIKKIIRKIEVVEEHRNVLIADTHKSTMTCEYSGLPSVKSYE